MVAQAHAPERRLTATGAHLLPEMKPAGTRGSILEAALRLFAEQGFEGASVRDIAQACGIRAATVYSHYPSKGHLLAELCHLGHSEHGRLMRSAVLDATDAPAAQIAALVRAHIDFHTSYPMLAVVANGELHSIPEVLSPPIYALRNQAISLFTEVVQRGVDREAFDVPDVWLATAAIGGMGLRVAYWFNPDGETAAEEVADGYVEFALRMLNAQRKEEAR